MTTCDRCGQSYFYDPRVHRCPGEWEAMCAEAGVTPLGEIELTTWVEECMAKQNGGTHG
jgi:hypothetical protein